MDVISFDYQQNLPVPVLPIGQSFTQPNTGRYQTETPQFSSPIENITVALGREAVLSCTVTELGNYKVGWMKADDQTILALHTRVITHNPRITVSHDDNLNTWQLRIRQLKESDRGCYMCQINTGEMKKQIGCIDVHGIFISDHTLEFIRCHTPQMLTKGWKQKGGNFDCGGTDDNSQILGPQISLSRRMPTTYTTSPW
ncbi:unnamed protein product [Acanthoscelides obtectus]|uniref:Ig-like domain-containing protein n=1 Tax=Acanthoscelides obtectus TaxID=200917 RepID=A0A9P0L7Q1_ACAOB|nr:unnamed protein product [Acanthoscelides obtectus]CAK1660233.1 Zwei Ig domain protein zig-8 [Acanthoscelides obtectus]